MGCSSRLPIRDAAGANRQLKRLSPSGYREAISSNGRYVFVEFGGRGPLDEFEQACNTVIESIKVKS